jgi:8-oxo-dGTP diphosphatase
MAKLVTAAIMMDGDRVLIAKRKASATSVGGWEFPGGKIEEGESPEACLAREMQEELGILVEVGSFFGESVYDYDDGTIELKAYWTRWISGDIRLNVHDEVCWVKPDMLQGFDFLPADVPLAEKLAAVGVSEH